MFQVPTFLQAGFYAERKEKKRPTLQGGGLLRAEERLGLRDRKKKIEGISDIRDESDREGIRIVVEIKRGENPEIVLNQLYKHTPMDSSFGIIMLALVRNQPRILNLRDLIAQFIEHRKEVVTKRTEFELRKAEARLHILEGLKIALDHLDEVITLIRNSADPTEAKEGLVFKLSLSDIQAQAILDMRLQRLTALEREKIIEERDELIKTVKNLKEILETEELLLDIIIRELEDIKNRYGDERRTEIIESVEEISVEDLIADEDMVVTITHEGYIKNTPLSVYRSQRRGGKGKAIVNLLNLSSNEKVAAVLPVREFKEDKFVVMATKDGVVKKTELMAYSNPRAGGIIAVNVREDDELISARMTSGNNEILLTTRFGQAIRFHEEEVRETGRGATGVIGIRLEDKDEVVSLEVIENQDARILTVTEMGYGKRTPVSEYRLTGRGGKGVITIKTTEKNGRVVGAFQVADDMQVILITTHGKIIRMEASEISVYKRGTQGLRLIELEPEETVAAVAKVIDREQM